MRLMLKLMICFITLSGLVFGLSVMTLFLLHAHPANVDWAMLIKAGSIISMLLGGVITLLVFPFPVDKESGT